MTVAVESVTTSALSLAMDAVSLRQEVLATNIANVDMPDYVPLSVNFEEQLGAARRALQTQGRLDPASLANVTPKVQVASDAKTGMPAFPGLSTGVTLDLEVARLSQNAGKYAMLAKLLSKNFGILSSAVSDGKR
jgi:flagellar basal-body rod protein FlgB